MAWSERQWFGWGKNVMGRRRAGLAPNVMGGAGRPQPGIAGDGSGLVGANWDGQAVPRLCDNVARIAAGWAQRWLGRRHGGGLGE